MTASTAPSTPWPALPFEQWRDTYATLHMWAQIVGKVRLAMSPRVNHWWQVPLYVTPRGLTTSAMPLARGGDGADRSFEIEFDFVEHRLTIDVSDGRGEALDLAPRPVAAFHDQLVSRLNGLGIRPEIWPVPVEVPAPVRFTDDQQHASYDPRAVERLHSILVASDGVFKEFRGRFLGKSSPVHFFWGSFDLAVTRFSGRPNPAAPADPIMREAYSHEVISHGFWPGGTWAGGAVFDAPLYYAYAVPEPPGMRSAPIEPADAHFHEKLGEFVMPYDAVRTSASPRDALMQFLQSTYAAAADAAGWDRASLDR